MHNLNIVLIEPQIPQNTGNISRTCAVTGAKLHLIRPFGFEITDSKLKRAGLDYWDKLDITYYDDIDEFFKINAAFTSDFWYFSTKAGFTYSDITYNNNCWLIFGREDRGIPETVLSENLSACVRIPMRDNLRSLNLSNSVAIGVYEVLRQWNFPDFNRTGSLIQ
ncbi:MAG: tRNA (cytidine(34)-2'-O)-methyltransferase [Ruminococcus sp.]|jgi:tRNA (cytidine/uridine-2'-O-)-methyltransferase|nr:tRNA (cytidine(34)-2'-O)-methyltransferase [Ruminococcus sp.]